MNIILIMKRLMCAALCICAVLLAACGGTENARTDSGGDEPAAELVQDAEAAPEQASTYYHGFDVARINFMIDNNGLGWTKASTGADTVPTDWHDGVTWSSDARGKRVVGLDVSGSELTGILDVSGLEALETLFCHNNELEAVDVSGLKSLKTLYCSSNELAALDVSECESLELLYCEGNQIEALDLSGLAQLLELNCSNNKIETLDVTGDRNLATLFCVDNEMKDEEDVVGLSDTQFEEWGSADAASPFMFSLVGPIE